MSRNRKTKAKRETVTDKAVGLGKAIAKHETIEWRKVGEWERKAEEYGAMGYGICQKGHMNSAMYLHDYPRCSQDGTLIDDSKVVKTLKCAKCGRMPLSLREKFCRRCGLEFGKPYIVNATSSSAWEQSPAVQAAREHLAKHPDQFRQGTASTTGACTHLPSHAYGKCPFPAPEGTTLNRNPFTERKTGIWYVVGMGIGLMLSALLWFALHQ